MQRVENLLPDVCNIEGAERVSNAMGMVSDADSHTSFGPRQDDHNDWKEPRAGWSGTHTDGRFSGASPDSYLRSMVLLSVYLMVTLFCAKMPKRQWKKKGG